MKNPAKPHTLARRLKKKTRFFVDNEFFEFGYAAKYRKQSVLDVYCVLAKYANYKKQTCFPSYERIMSESGIKNKNTAVNAVKKLEELNVITIWHSKGHSPNVYLLQDTSVWIREKSITGDTVEPYQRHYGVHRI